MPYSSIEEKQIAELCKIIDCEHKTAPYVNSSDYLVVRTSNVKNGQLVMESMKCTTQSGYKEWTQRAVPEYGDVLFTREAPAGESCLVPQNMKTCMGQRMVLLRPNRKKTDPIFLSLILATERSKSDISRLSIGSTVSRINIADIKKLKVPAPPLPEQKKIAKILSTWDQAINVTEKLIENSKAQKKSLMQQLLTGEKRLKGFNNDWEICSIKQMGRTISGGTPDTKNLKYWNGNVLWITPTDITALKNRYIYNTNRKITEHGVKNSSATPLPKNSLLVCTRATIGYLAISTTEICTNQGFKSLVPNKNFNVDYLYYLFSYFRNLFIRYSCGSTFLELSKKDFSKLSFLCPGLKEQQKIAAILSTADKEIELLQQKHAFLIQEKKALMQQLLTGKRRVKIN